MFDDYSSHREDHRSHSLRDRIWRVVFLSDSRSGKAFDVVLLWLIGVSIVVVMLESVPDYQARYGSLLVNLEWVFTILFTIEYIVRIWVVRDKWAYISSFFGVVDLVSILPTYLALFLAAGPQYLIVVRMLRLLRVFRILKMARHLGEANLLLNAMRASWAKVSVFLFFVFSVTTILGTIMFIIEGIVAGNEGFYSVPQSVYWAIVTLSTVGYGDVVPLTPVGKMISTLLMLIGYGTIAVPTGIVTAELSMNIAAIRQDTRRCRECGHVGHDPRAGFCKMCGRDL